jgi:hypothetical protein
MTGDEPGFVLQILICAALLFVAAFLFLVVYGMWWVG